MDGSQIDAPELSSPLTQGCELKYTSFNTDLQGNASPLTWGRELKYRLRVHDRDLLYAALYIGARIEIALRRSEPFKLAVSTLPNPLN